MKAFLGWCSILSAAWSVLTFIVGGTEQGIYFILLSIWLLSLAEAK